MGQDAFIPAQNGAAGGGGAGTASAISSIAAGTTVATGPLVSFANANNVSFGLNGNTVTASASVPAGATATGNFGALSAAGGAISSGTASFANGGGVSFGVNAQTVTASVAAGATATGNLGAVAAVGGTITSGTASFANSNGMSFGVNGQTVTAEQAPWLISVDGYGAPVSMGTNSSLIFSLNANIWGQTTIPGQVRLNLVSGPLSVSAGTQQNAGGPMLFANANGVTFGMSGSSRITASIDGSPTLRYWNNGYGNFGQSGSIGPGGATFVGVVHRTVVPGQLSMSQLELVAAIPNGVTGTVTFSAVIYTMSASTAASIASGTRSIAGLSLIEQIVSVPLAASLTGGDYLIGVWASAIANTGAAFAVNLMGAKSIVPVTHTTFWRNANVTLNTTASSNTASINMSQQVTAAALGVNTPYMALIGSG